MFKFSFKTLFFGFYLCAVSAFASDQIPKPESISVSHTEGKGLGYSRGYTSLDLFLSQPFCPIGLVPFLDLRGHIFNNCKYAANAGLGLRWLSQRFKQTWGVNWFYDYFLTSHRPYNQVAMGLEVLSESWSVNLNGYLPVGRKETPLYQFSYESISPNGFLVKGREQFAMRGIDAEFGYRFCNIHRMNFDVGLGPYYYWGRSAATENAFRPSRKQAFGGRLNVAASYYNYITAEGIVTYDSLFKWGGQATIALTLPFNFTCKTGKCGGSCCLQERLYQPVQRNEIIVVDRIQRTSSNPSILDPEFEP